MFPHFFKSPFVKGIINTQAVNGAKTVKAAYAEFIKKNGHAFKEKKRETKLKHGIEKIGAKKDNKENKNGEKDKVQ